MDAVLAEHELLTAIEEENQRKALAREQKAKVKGSDGQSSKKRRAPSSTATPAGSEPSTKAKRIKLVSAPKAEEIDYPCILCPSLDVEGLLPVGRVPSFIASKSKEEGKVWYAHTTCAYTIPEVRHFKETKLNPSLMAKHLPFFSL